MSELNGVRTLRALPANADRIDLKERESELDFAASTLNGQIASIEHQMQREMAAWSTAREGLALVNPS
jgi:hypothetical protein